ncbi:glycosyltransferase family 2 protein [Alkalihalobacillus sp. LMS39]|uniref:glycosyltransferase family 2 protein n=1 Tax=Alkalihalobacillus sp. LMS39 TaxID=2924032 RepID=UPI001FB27F7B|nr:glycosyltransferase family 2 protein [Alkalihalobacillus sp. LMS39]UOE93829.1 glycosyltransferase [Alkalihalobacillus sp. LMS39]
MENQQELVSVITPAYNAEKFIGDAIESVLAQTYPHWEMIIVDDCSTDETAKVVEQYSDKRIRFIQLKKNSGPAIARNTSIQNAKGRYIAFLDSDDMWQPDKLEKQLAFMRRHDIAFSYTAYENMGEDGKSLGTVVPVLEKANYDKLLKENVIGCLTVMLDLSKVGPIEMVNIRTRQDYVLWLDICKRGFLAYGLKEVLAKYRVVENSISSNKLKMARQNWKVYREIENLNLIKSVWYFTHYMYYKVKKYGVKT